MSTKISPTPKLRKTFFTADTHFGHTNIINYCKRPFYSVEQMNAQLIARWNSVVGEDDTVYHLGDFATHTKPGDMESILYQLNGNKILCRGNHDHKTSRELSGWDSVINLQTLVIDNVVVAMCHYPMECWDRSSRGSIHIHGHCHGTLPGNRQRLDVGVDCWDFYPVTIEQIVAKMATLPERPPEF